MAEDPSGMIGICKDKNLKIWTGPKSIITTTGPDQTRKIDNWTGPTFDNQMSINNWLQINGSMDVIQGSGPWIRSMDLMHGSVPWI